jgi:hypothetical protein
MDQLSGTNRLIFRVGRDKSLSRFRDNTGTKSGTNKIAVFCGFYRRDNMPGQTTGQGRDNGTTGTKGFSLVPVVPARLALAAV